MRVLLSFESEFASKIFDGSKKCEYHNYNFQEGRGQPGTRLCVGGPCGIGGRVRNRPYFAHRFNNAMVKYQNQSKQYRGSIL